MTRLKQENGMTTNARLALCLVFAAAGCSAEYTTNYYVNDNSDAPPDMLGNDKPDLVTTTDLKDTRNECVALIFEGNFRPSDTLVADGQTWNSMAQAKLANFCLERACVQQMSVTSLGDAATYYGMSVAKDGAVHAWNIFKVGKNQSQDLDITSQPICVDSGSSIAFQLWAKFAKVAPSSSVGGTWDNAPRSGAYAALGINANLQTGAWDSQYAGEFNVLITGDSGARFFARGQTTLGPTFVIRKSKPIVTKAPLANHTLASGLDLDAFKTQIGADPNDSIAVKQWAYTIQAQTNLGSSLKIVSPKVRCGTADFTSSQIMIQNELGDDLSDGYWDLTAKPKGMMIPVLTNEETISGSGNVYTLHFQVLGSIATGDSLVVCRHQVDSTVKPVTGYLDFQATQTNGLPFAGYQIDTGLKPGGSIVSGGGFLWSDTSEHPHSDAIGLNYGSRDWTNEAWLSGYQKECETFMK
ncbi:MAG TPA: hypothetical protein VFQ60_00840 [Patescibacteria group bacterium]|nr:hypothetical protein [Patescibacteria group bacterium]